MITLCEHCVLFRAPGVAVRVVAAVSPVVVVVGNAVVCFVVVAMTVVVSPAAVVITILPIHSSDFQLKK